MNGIVKNVVNVLAVNKKLIIKIWIENFYLKTIYYAKNVLNIIIAMNIVLYV